jgi:hypothetical protein
MLRLKLNWSPHMRKLMGGNTAALLERLASDPHARLRSFCSPQHTDSALYPIIGQMERAAGLARHDKPQAKLDKLDAMLAQSSTSAQDAALFAEMLSLANDGRYPSLELTPQQRRQRTLEALVLQVAALSRQNPVLMIFEDAHCVPLSPLHQSQPRPCAQRSTARAVSFNDPKQTSRTHRLLYCTSP